MRSFVFFSFTLIPTWSVIRHPIPLPVSHFARFACLLLILRPDCEVDKIYQVLKQASDLSSKSSNVNRNLLTSESYQSPNVSSSNSRREFYLEKTSSFERSFLVEKKSDYYYPNQKPQKSYSRSEYQTTPECYPTVDFYQHSPPKPFKNRLSDPGVIQLNNAACLGPSAVVGTATLGPSCVESVSQQRRQQGPLLLRGNTSHSVGPAPFATSSGAYF